MRKKIIKHHKTFYPGEKAELYEVKYGHTYITVFSRGAFKKVHACKIYGIDCSKLEYF